MFNREQIGIRFHERTATISDGFRSDWDSQAMELVSNSSRLGYCSDNNAQYGMSNCVVSYGHACYTTACRYVQKKHQQVRRLHTPFDRRQDQKPFFLFATRPHPCIFPFSRTIPACNINVKLKFTAAWSTESVCANELIESYSYISTTHAKLISEFSFYEGW